MLSDYLPQDTKEGAAIPTKETTEPGKRKLKADPDTDGPPKKKKRKGKSIAVGTANVKTEEAPDYIPGTWTSGAVRVKQENDHHHQAEKPPKRE
jgi:hypothetical protein